jgi:inorganic pyrophosphatase
MILHPWHEVAPNYDRKKSHVDAIIEIPQGSKAKYEVDKKSGLLRLDRVVYAAFHYPINYGFIPQTLGEDGDPLDILVFSQVSIQPLCLVSCHIIGVMEMEDMGQKDEKIIAVANDDPSVEDIKKMGDLPPYLLEEIKHFFQQYKVLRNKKVLVDEFLPREIALDFVEEALVRYEKEMK